MYKLKRVLLISDYVSCIKFHHCTWCLLHALHMLQSIVEKFHHNPALAPNDDVAQRLFQFTDTTRIRVTYHLEPNRITASYREFLTPPRGGEQAYNLTFDPQATSGYQVSVVVQCTYMYS